MKKTMLLICGVIFFAGCASKIDPTPGDKCKPKWYKAESSDSKMVFGYSRERSRSSSLATSIGLAAAQVNALQQINVHIKSEAGKQAEDKLRDKYGEKASDYSEAMYEKLKIIIDQPCNYCALDESVECEDDGYLVVYTRVKVNVEDYLNQGLRDQMDKLLEKPEEMLNEIKEF